MKNERIGKSLYLLCLAALFCALAGAKVFDGTGDGYTIDNPNKGSTSYTIGCWLYDASTAEDGNIMNYGTGNARGFDWYEYTGGFS